MMLFFRFNNSWLFNAQWDLICLLGPFIVSFYFMGAKYETVDNSLLSYFVAKVFLGGGHIFATYVPFFTGHQLKERIAHKIPVFPLIFVSIYAVFNFINELWFQNLLAISGLFHIYTQHIAFLKVLNKNELPARRDLEKRVCLLIIGIPNIIWMLNQLNNKPSYLYAVTFTRFIPDFGFFNQSTLLILSFLAALATLFISIRVKERIVSFDFGKFIFFGSTAFWMCYGLFFVKALGFFHTYLAMGHGITYIVYISRGWPSHPYNGFWNSNYRFLKVSIFAIVLGYGWSYGFRLWKDFPPALAFVPWLPLIIHYAYDSMIWRRWVPAQRPAVETA